MDLHITFTKLIIIADNLMNQYIFISEAVILIEDWISQYILYLEYEEH